MNTSFDHLSDQELGERLRKARENAKLKQAEAAFKLDMAPARQDLWTISERALA